MHMCMELDIRKDTIYNIYYVAPLHVSQATRMLHSVVWER